jgi:hypothetical protein
VGLLSSQVISQRLLAMGKLMRFPKPLDGEVVALWLAIMSRAEVTQDEWLAATDWVMAREEDFPAPATVLAVIRRARAEGETERFASIEMPALPEPARGIPSFLAKDFPRVLDRLAGDKSMGGGG